MVADRSSRYARVMSAIAAAADWFIALLAGPVVTILLILAVATFGLGLLLGRLSIRRGMEVAIGCFLLIGAADVSGSLLSIDARDELPALPVAPVSIEEGTLPALDPDRIPSRRNGNPFDPYAGGSSAR